MKLRIKKLGHDKSGYMITDEDTLEIISKHKTKESAIKMLNLLRWRK
ncbi:MAG: hypothetical protein U9R08_03635 [Nanoarchaeota archaeon]|nr:hypothetical protein [Nanoarchaeota archaeon]